MRTGHHRTLFVLCRASTEGVWALALAGFLLHATTGKPFPLLAGLAAFGAAMIVSRATGGRGWRRATLLGLHLLGLLGCLAAAIPGGLQGPAWLPREGDWREWAWAGQTAFWIAALWVKGVGAARNPGTRERIGTQFDKGVAAFGLVLLSGLFLELKWGVTAAWAGSLPLFFLFFGASVMAMGLSFPAGQEDTRSFEGRGAPLGFALLVLGVGTGVIGLLMPALNELARLGYEVLESTASPMGPVLVRILRFIFARRRTSPDQAEMPAGQGDPGIVPSAEGLEIGPVEWVLGWGLTGLLVAVLGCVSVFAVFHVIKALLARTRSAPAVGDGSPSLPEWLRRMLDLLLLFRPRAWMQALRDPGPIRLFARLAAWGRHSGLPRRSNETPLEYGTRLSVRFADLSGHIGLIVDLVNREVYGDVSPGPDLRTKGLVAWRRLRSPRHWPSRARALLFTAGASFPTREPGPARPGEPGAGH